MARMMPDMCWELRGVPGKQGAGAGLERLLTQKAAFIVALEVTLRASLAGVGRMDPRGISGAC